MKTQAELNRSDPLNLLFEKLGEFSSLQDSSLTPLFWFLDPGPGPRGLGNAVQRQTSGARERGSEGGREGATERGRLELEREKKQNERLVAGVNCLSHQTDFLIS